MARYKHRSQLSAIQDINMTPLIDLTFLLLIVFMITVPLLEFGVDVSPPEMNADQLPEKENKTINIDKHGKIKYDKKAVTLQELQEELKYVRDKNKDTVILIRADGDRQYKEVMTIMKVVKDVGIKNVSLITQAEQ